MVHFCDDGEVESGIGEGKARDLFGKRPCEVQRIPRTKDVAVGNIDAEEMDFVIIWRARLELPLAEPTCHSESFNSDAASAAKPVGTVFRNVQRP